jgi:TonB-dependent receptor
MFTFQRILLVMFLIIVGIPNLTAQDTPQQARSGQVEGRVTDLSTGEPLVGANVIIQGTNLGSATDIYGQYRIPIVPAGIHTIVVSYIGYETVRNEIEVTGGEINEYNASLAFHYIEGELVTITGQAEGQMRAINEQLRARTIKNVVAAERIQELPDDNAATALSRLPGISLQEGDKVVVRGIQAKLNTVLVNGVQLPSTTTNDRSTNLGFISSNMLAGIEVTKAVTPEMDANSIGGVVNLRLREAPTDWHFDLLSQGSYNTQNRTYPGENYQLWMSVSNRFIDNRLGVFLQGNAYRQDSGPDIGNAVYENMGPGGDRQYGEATYGMQQFEYINEINVNQQYGGSLILDYLLPRGKLMLQNTYAYTNPNNTQHMDRLNLDSGALLNRLERNIYSKHLLINALQGENRLGLIDIDYGVSHVQSRQDTDLWYWIEWNPVAAFTAIREIDPSGDRNLSRLYFTPENVYDIEYFDDFRATQSVRDGSTREENFMERQVVAQMNVSVPVTISSLISGTVKTGGKVNFLSRENDTQRSYARLSEGDNNRAAQDFLTNVVGVTNWNSPLRFLDFRDDDFDRGQYFLGGLYDMQDVIRTDWMDEYMRLAPAGWPRGNVNPFNHIADSRRFDYETDERLSAGYIMADMNIGSRLTVLTGVRYEHFEMDYEATYMLETHFDGNGREIFIEEQIEEMGEPLTVAKRSVDHWFPNLQVRYWLTDWFDVRLAYTKTLSRPNFNQLMPNIFVAQAHGEAGNPNLRPTVSDNYDIYFSFSNNTIGLFTVGGFYKRLEDVILQQQIQRDLLELYAPGEISWPDPATGLPNIRATQLITTFVNNPHPATVQGIEFDWQTHFWYLPQPFNSIIMNINYTRIFSEMDYRQIVTIRRTDPNTGLPIFEVKDTVRTARLIHQGNDVINVAIGADYRGFSGRLSFRLQGDVITNVGNRPEEDAFTEDVYSWDFTLRQRLPIRGVSIFLSGMNITHAPTHDFRHFRRNLAESIIDNRNRTAYNFRRFELGLRYSF